MPHLSAQERRRHFHGELLPVRATKISCTSYQMGILTKAFWRSICAAHIMRIRISLQYIRDWALLDAVCTIIYVHRYFAMPACAHVPQNCMLLPSKISLCNYWYVAFPLASLMALSALQASTTDTADTRPFIPGKRMSTSGSKSSIFTWLHGLVVR